MPNYDQLNAMGSDYLERFEEVDFVGEIEVSEEEIQSVLPALSKSIFKLTLEDDISALLSVVVVNLAFYSDEDSDGFRRHVLDNFGIDSIQHSTQIWEEHFGAPILNTLKKHFRAEDISGPYRFVRPIMQQAGISASSRQQFVNFFLVLIDSSGYPFSRFDFRRFKSEHRVQSSSLNYFLETEAGWRYCSEVARIIRNLKDRLFDHKDIEGLPSRFRETVRAIEEKLRQVSPIRLKKENIPPPRFALDKAMNRLVARFSEKGINGINSMYALNDATPILQTHYALSTDDLRGGFLKGTVRQPKGVNTNWELPLWTPAENRWGAFDVGTGSFIQSEGRLEPGEYLIIVRDGILLPDVREDLGYLDFQEDSLFRIYHADLKNNFSLPEICLTVGVHETVVPQLRFRTPKRALLFTDNVFVGNCPQIEVVNWTEETASKYLLLLDDGIQRSKVPIEKLQEGDLLPEKRDLPYRAEVHVESIGKSLNIDRFAPLGFTVLPSDFKFEWKDELYEDTDQPRLRLVQQASVIWNNNSLEVVREGTWRARPKVSVLETRIGYGSDFSFPLTIPVFRFRVHGDPIKDDLLWQDVLSSDGELTFRLSRNERGQNIEIGLYVDGSFIKIADSQKIPDRMELRVSTPEIRDAFEDCAEVVGLLAVKVRSGKVLCSNITYINDQKIINQALDESFELWGKLLPEELTKSLDSIRKSATLGGDDKQPLPSFWIPDRLREWISSFEPNLDDQIQTLKDWSEAVRSEYWDTAKNSVLGQEQLGQKLVEAAREYRLALGMNQGSPGYNRFLTAAYRKFDGLLASNDLRTELARCIRLMCCVRLNRNAGFEEEFEKLSPKWSKAKTALRNRMYSHAATDLGDSIAISDISLHEDDLEYFN